MYGAVDFYRACKAEGIKPIIGCEVYVAPRAGPGSIRSTSSTPRAAIWCCCAKTRTGYRNLSYMVSMALDGGLLHQAPHRPGPAAAALRGPDRPVRLPGRRDPHAACGTATMTRPRTTPWTMQELFGPDNFYLELQDHGIPEQTQVNRGLLRLHQETGIPLVCTNDAHYLRKEDAESARHPAVHPDRQDGGRRKPHALSSRRISISAAEEEMAALFAGYPEAMENTAEDRASCASWSSPSASTTCRSSSCPEGYDCCTYLRKLCDEGLPGRYGDEPTELPRAS